MLEHTDETTFAHSFPSVALGFFLRYPSPYSPHVVTSDTLSQHLDSTTGILHTTKLLLKRGSLPRWAPRGMMERAESWVVEESEVDVERGEMRVTTRNVDHTVVLEVVDTQLMRARGPKETEVITSARITSSWGFFLIRRRIEHFGLKRFQRQLPLTRSGILSAVSLVHPSSPYRGAMLRSEKVERQEDVEAMRLSRRVRGRLEVLRARARKRRREWEEMLRGESGVLAKEKEEEVEAQAQDEIEEGGEEPMTDEEHAELASLEKEEEEHSASNRASTPAPPADQPTSSIWTSSSWLWWFRWKLAGIERPSKEQDGRSTSSSASSSVPASSQDSTRS